MSELLISLKARRDACRNYELNTELQIEAHLLDAQITAIEQRSTRQQDKQKALDEFEAAVEGMAWKGSQMLKDRLEIDDYYNKTKARLKSLLFGGA